MLTAATAALTVDQRRIVEWGDGPVVVICGLFTDDERAIAAHRLARAGYQPPRD